MKLLRLQLSALLLSILTSFQINAQPVPFTDKRWNIQAQGSVIEPFKGYTSLYLQNGKAWLKDEQFSDGIIEFDIYLPECVSFSGVMFRMIDNNNYEDLYFRPHLSDRPDAFQYTPVFNGNSSWQLYHDQYDGVNDGFLHFQPTGERVGYNGLLHFDFNRWMHVKLLVKGTQAEMYFDNSDEPAVFISDLKHGSIVGGIGFSSSIGAAHFANFNFTKTGNITFKGKQPVLKPVPGIVTQWQVSSTFKEISLRGKTQLDPKLVNDLKWKTMQADRTGLINISTIASVKDSNNTVLASIKIISDKDQIKKMDFGYSDRAYFFVNNQLVYFGTNEFRTRDYRFLGTIGYFQSIYLPLKKGENTITIAIAESFGGWAVEGKFEE